MSAVPESALCDWSDALNAEQRAAAGYGERTVRGFESGPLLIIAGAGTGKTNTLAHRVAHLRLNGVPAERILLLTFTRRAAEEMSRRAERIVQTALLRNPSTRPRDAESKLSWAGTFHSIANRILRQRANRIGLDPSFSVMDRGDSADLLDVVRHDAGLAKKEKRFPRKDTCLAIYSHKVNTQCALKHTLKESFPWCAEWESELTQLFRKYVEAKQQQHVLDYDDLLLYWRFAVQDKDLAGELGALFDHILVDEYQDTNTLQADILFAMKPEGFGVCVVGDDAQAIYSFRAANVENILNFPGRYSPTAAIAKLEKNYRSVQPILDAANTLMGEGARQYQKKLKSDRPSKQKPRHVSVADDQGQADYVVERILGNRESGIALKRQAVLMRSSHHSDLLEIELMRRNIPYVKYGGLKFLEAAHVKDVLAVLKWADNAKNRIAGFRVLQLLPGVGPSHANRCLNVFEAGGFSWDLLSQYQMPASAKDDWTTTSALLSSLASATQWAGQVSAVKKWYESHLMRIYEAGAVRMGDIEQLERISGQYPSRERFVTELTLDPPHASGDLAGPPLLDEDYLVLSTVHSAKGQEWDSVFVLNVVDGNFPSEFSGGKPELIEEERRLLYVAMTRAKQDLHLISPLKYYITQQARHGDNHVYGAKSRFMTEAFMNTLDNFGWPPQSADYALKSSNAPQRVVDVKEKMRAMWD